MFKPTAEQAFRSIQPAPRRRLNTALGIEMNHVGFRITPMEKLLGLANVLLYGCYLANHFLLTYFPRIEVTTGQPYEWPMEFRLLFLMQFGLSVAVFFGLGWYFHKRSVVGLWLVSFAVTLDAGMGLRGTISAHPQIIGHGVSFGEVPWEYLGPASTCLMALLNWAWFKRAAA